MKKEIEMTGNILAQVIPKECPNYLPYNGGNRVNLIHSNASKKVTIKYWMSSIMNPQE